MEERCHGALQQSLFTVEMVVNGALGDPGLRGYLVNRGAVVAFGTEQLQCRLGDLIRAFGRSALARFRSTRLFGLYARLGSPHLSVAGRALGSAGRSQSISQA
jgi:hypothetical protein